MEQEIPQSYVYANRTKSSGDIFTAVCWNSWQMIRVHWGIFEVSAWERKSFISSRKREGRIIICDYGTYLPHVSRYHFSLFALDQRRMCASLNVRECKAKRHAIYSRSNIK